MLLYPGCKINLGLRITSRRPDGYHNIESVFYPVPWLTDIVEVALPAPNSATATDAADTLTVTGLPVPGPTEKNLCLKAAAAVRDAARRGLVAGGRTTEGETLPPVAINLHKTVPMGAGLGGGSADATAVIAGMNIVLRLGLSEVQMRGIAASVGADCAFFVSPRPQLAEGIGDILTPAQICADNRTGNGLASYHINIVKPPVSVSTREAYAAISPAVPEERVADIVKGAPETWRGRLLNDFESAVAARFPIIDNIKRTLYAGGCAYASMSGSGSAVFGISAEPLPPETRAALETMGQSFFH